MIDLNISIIKYIMELIHKIVKSRDVLRKHLTHEWDTSVIQNLSVKEMEKIYTAKATTNDLFASLGQGIGCNVSLQNRFIPSHTLHIIYYNFPRLGEKPIKITKTCQDKISQLYISGMLLDEDSIIMILCNPISETVATAIENFNAAGQHLLSSQKLSEDIQKENDSLSEDERYSMRHFRNIHLFYLDHLAIDITNHALVPVHECKRDTPTITKILEKCNATVDQIPVIKRTDPQAKLMRMSPGDLCEIKRPTLAGEIITYRICQ